FDHEMYFAAQAMAGLDTSRFLLNEGLLKLPRGMAQTYQEMAVRGQYFAHLAEKLNLSPREMDRYLEKNAISDAEHDRLIECDAYPLFAALEVAEEQDSSIEVVA
ncbi:MAG TPA: hypothetical protein VF450_05460, partial [Noviherbaspirillum sp.]